MITTVVCAGYSGIHLSNEMLIDAYKVTSKSKVLISIGVHVIFLICWLNFLKIASKYHSIHHVIKHF